MTVRPVLIDSGLGQLGSSGQVTFGLPVPVRQVSRVRLREALIPRTDDLLYVLVGFRFGSGSACDNLQIPHDPTLVTVQNAQGRTGLSQHPPLFAAIPIAQAGTVASLVVDSVTVPYAYVNQERFSATFRPPVQALDTIEMQLYRPPSAGDPATLVPYDIRAYKAMVDVPQGGKLPAAGDQVTNIQASDQNAAAYSFTANVVAVSPSTQTDATGATIGNVLLLGSFSSYPAAEAYRSFLGTPGILNEEREIYQPDTGKVVGSVSSVSPVSTQTVLSLELECAS